MDWRPPPLLWTPSQKSRPRSDCTERKSDLWYILISLLWRFRKEQSWNQSKLFFFFGGGGGGVSWGGVLFLDWKCPLVLFALRFNFSVDCNSKMHVKFDLCSGKTWVWCISEVYRTNQAVIFLYPINLSLISTDWVMANTSPLIWRKLTSRKMFRLRSACADMTHLLINQLSDTRPSWASWLLYRSGVPACHVRFAIRTFKPSPQKIGIINFKLFKDAFWITFRGRRVIGHSVSVFSLSLDRHAMCRNGNWIYFAFNDMLLYDSNFWFYTVFSGFQLMNYWFCCMLFNTVYFSYIAAASAHIHAFLELFLPVSRRILFPNRRLFSDITITETMDNMGEFWTNVAMNVMNHRQDDRTSDLPFSSPLCYLLSYKGSGVLCGSVVKSLSRYPGSLGSSRTGSSGFFVGVSLGKTLKAQPSTGETHERHE